MPKMPIDEAPAGLEMDAAVAEALGWIKKEWDGVYYWKDPGVDDFYPGHVASNYSSMGHKLEDRKAWSPSTDIAAAWELFEQLRYAGATLGWSREWLVPYVSLPVPELIIEENLGCYGTVYADSAELAICRAFLRANGIEYIEIKDENTD